MRSAAGDYEIDDDPARIDAGAAVAFLTTEAYWGRWRDEADIRGQIAAAWRVVGAYDRAGAMVGFARAFSDGGNAYLADVYVLPAHRGAGLGKAIIRAMIDDGPGAGQRWMLHTSDAHGLYREFGFSPRPRHRQVHGTPSRRTRGGHGRAGPGRLPGTLAEARSASLYLSRCGTGTCPALVAAAAGGGELYRWSPVPQDEAPVRRYVETAVAAGDTGTAVPFAVVRLEDDVVIGSTRFWNLDYWAWPRAEARAARHVRDRLSPG